MITSLSARVLTVALDTEQKAEVSEILRNNYKVKHAKDFAEVSKINNEIDAYLVTGAFLKANETAVATLASGIPIAYLGAKIEFEIPYGHVDVPIKPESLLSILDTATGGTRSAKINWSQLKIGLPVSSRIIPNWGIGVVVALLKQNYLMVLFPCAQKPFNTRPIVCHATVLKSTSVAQFKAQELPTALNALLERMKR